MSARTCLLCGKALSRIWVGAGEDFCSREHRNQYRLRRGMDRLQEAGKVANLMRRRENPKPIPSLHQVGNADSLLADSSQIRILGRRSALELPATKWSPPVRIPSGRGYISRYGRSIADGKSRDFAVPRPKAGRVILQETARAIAPPGANYRERIKRHGNVRPAPRHGQALRVSSSAGFRLPVQQPLKFRAAARRPAMIWPSRLRPGALHSVDFPATYTIRVTRFNLPVLEVPSSPVPERKAALIARGATVLKRRIVTSGDPAEARPSGALWTDWALASPAPIRHAGDRMPPPRFVSLPQKAMAGEPTSHLVLVPLMPEDRAFSYIPEIVVSPAGLTGVPKATLEDQFDAGLRNWSGGIDDWVLDAAGARTGSLALFTPTLDRRDYDMEFLARIDHRSVRWVFRASNLNDYHMASITITPDGSYEFRRGVTAGNNADWASPLPIRMTLNRKNALNVRLRAQGSDFTISIEGQVIDTWFDSRLPTGGIGFMGAPDDRARIYWVRLSPLGSPGKEYPRR